MDPETAIPTCYRHPDRETRLSCSQCGKPTCVECTHRAAVGQKCPECAAPDGRSRVIHARDIRSGGFASAPFTYGTIGVCAGVLLLTFVPGLGDVVFGFMVQQNAAIAQGQLWRLITPVFLHLQLFHIFFNMFALNIFGPTMEREVGSGSFAALYLASGLAGSVAFYFLGGAGGALGASGAVFGLFGAWLAAAVRNRGTLQGQANLRGLGMLLAINLGITFIIPRIAWQAHIGGLVAGFAIMMAWQQLGMDRLSAAKRVWSAVAVGVACVALVVLA